MKILGCTENGYFWSSKVLTQWCFLWSMSEKMQKTDFFLWGSYPPEKPPKGVNEKNGNGLKTPLSPHFLEKISTLSTLKLFISFQNFFTFFRFSP